MTDCVTLAAQKTTGGHARYPGLAPAERGEICLAHVA